MFRVTILCKYHDQITLYQIYLKDFPYNIRFDFLRFSVQVCIWPSNPWTIFGPIFQSALRGSQTNFFNFFLIGASAKKALQGQAFPGMGCLRIFWVKGKKNKGRLEESRVRSQKTYINGHSYIHISWYKLAVGNNLFTGFPVRICISKVIGQKVNRDGHADQRFIYVDFFKWTFYVSRNFLYGPLFLSNNL